MAKREVPSSFSPESPKDILLSRKVSNPLSWVSSWKTWGLNLKQCFKPTISPTACSLWVFQTSLGAFETCVYLGVWSRIHSARSGAVLTTRASWLVSVPSTGGYGRNSWPRTSATRTIQTRTPAHLGPTPTARAAPTPDSLDSAGVRSEAKD